LPPSSKISLNVLVSHGVTAKKNQVLGSQFLVWWLSYEPVGWETGNLLPWKLEFSSHRLQRNCKGLAMCLRRGSMALALKMLDHIKVRRFASHHLGLEGWSFT